MKEDMRTPDIIPAGKLKTIPIRQIVQERLKEMDKTRNWLSVAVQRYGLGRMTVYNWLDGKTLLNSEAVGHVLYVLGLKIRRAKKPPVPPTPLTEAEDMIRRIDRRYHHKSKE